MPVPETVVLVAATAAPVVNEEALARREQASANAREVARLQELMRQEKQQELRLVAIRQRQAIQQAAAEAQARAAARQLARETAKTEAREAAKADALAPSAVANAPERSITKARAAENKPSETREKEIAAVSAAADEAPALKSTAGVYTVRRGDYLTRLARERGLSVGQLVAWNRLESEAVVPGQKLVFQAPAAEETDAPPVTAKKPRREMSATHPEVAKAALATAHPGRPAELNAAAPQVHRVQQGDTLFNISQRFKVSVQVLRELNHLKTDEVKLGQKLLVPQS